MVCVTSALGLELYFSWIMVKYCIQYYIVHFCIKKVAALVLILCVPPMVFSTGQYSRWVGKKVKESLSDDAAF